MKPLKEYLLSESSTSVSIMQPRTNRELKGLVEELIKERGTKADLNDIDTSLIFHATWCGPCRAMSPIIDVLQIYPIWD